MKTNKTRLYAIPQTTPPAESPTGTGQPVTGGDPVILNPNPQATDAVIFFYFGTWTALPGQPAAVVTVTAPIEYKADFLTDLSRSIVFVKGQFFINAAVASQTIGRLPAGTRPVGDIKIYQICNNVEYYLIIQADGFINLTAKDEFNLATGTDPFSFNVFFRPGLPAVEYEVVKFASFARANCADGYKGSDFVFTKKYTSLVSQAAAQTLSDNDAGFNAEGQAAANVSGICELRTVYSYIQTADFTRNNCAPGSGSAVAVSFSATYNSFISEADAQNKAAQDIDYLAQGQAYANANGVCVVLPVVTYRASRAQDFNRNNCGSGSGGSTVNFSKNYTSDVSQAAAQSLADNDAGFNAEGQAYANANGICVLSGQRAINLSDNPGFYIEYRQNGSGDGFIALQAGENVRFGYTVVEIRTSQAFATRITANGQNTDYPAGSTVIVYTSGNITFNIV
jgi:hypothetical protein